MHLPLGTLLLLLASHLHLLDSLGSLSIRVLVRICVKTNVSGSLNVSHSCPNTVVSHSGSSVQAGPTRSKGLGQSGTVWYIANRLEEAGAG
jgi:hypothetical protein